MSEPTRHRSSPQEPTLPLRVHVRRDPEDARFWLADVLGIEGAHTSSRSLATLDRYVREVVVLAADLPDDVADRLALEWHYETGDPDADEAAARLRSRRKELDQAARDLAEQTGALARQLVRIGRLSVREAATVLGVSPARVDQLVRENPERPERVA